MKYNKNKQKELTDEQKAAAYGALKKAIGIVYDNGLRRFEDFVAIMASRAPEKTFRSRSLLRSAWAHAQEHGLDELEDISRAEANAVLDKLEQEYHEFLDEFEFSIVDRESTSDILFSFVGGEYKQKKLSEEQIVKFNKGFAKLLKSAYDKGLRRFEDFAKMLVGATGGRALAARPYMRSAWAYAQDNGFDELEDIPRLEANMVLDRLEKEYRDYQEKANDDGLGLSGNTGEGSTEAQGGVQTSGEPEEVQAGNASDGGSVDSVSSAEAGVRGGNGTDGQGGTVQGSEVAPSVSGGGRKAGGRNAGGKKSSGKASGKGSVGEQTSGKPQNTEVVQSGNDNNGTAESERAGVRDEGAPSPAVEQAADNNFIIDEDTEEAVLEKDPIKRIRANEDKIKYNIEKIRSYIDALVCNGDNRFDKFAVSIAEKYPSFYIRSRWQLEELWNQNATICHAKITTQEEVIRGIEKADSILIESGHIALKRHIFPKNPREYPLPFFFLELAKSKLYPKLVLKCHGVFRKTIKQYMLPVKLPSSLAQASVAYLRPYVPECAWEYLSTILGTLNIVFAIKPPRNSIAGNCSLNVVDGLARVTLNTGSNKWKFLCTLLHEISHALNPSQYSPHDVCWKSIYATLLADFYDYFPDEYKSELVWGMVCTPAALRSTNFYGRAVLFGISDTLTEEERRKNLLDLEKLRSSELVKSEIENWNNVRKDSITPFVLQTNAAERLPALILKGKNVSGFSIHQDNIAPYNLPYDFSYRKNTFHEQYEVRQRFSGELYIPIDLETDQRFLHFLDKMPIKSQNIVWNLYAREYGDGAYRYARNTEYAWKNGTVRGWAAGRFFDLVPIVFPLSRKKELFKTILDFSDSIRVRQLRYRALSTSQVLVSNSDFAEKSHIIIRYLKSFATKEASEFDYDKIYNFNSWRIPLWMQQSDIEAYRKELSAQKQTEILALANELEDMVMHLQQEFVKNEKASSSLMIDFPSKSFNIRIVSPFRGLLHNVALALGLTKDFI